MRSVLRALGQGADQQSELKDLQLESGFAYRSDDLIGLVKITVLPCDWKTFV
jgi:hypothetical protein